MAAPDLLEESPPAPAGLIRGPSYRILRVTTPEMLTVYDREWRSAIRDFHTRTQLTHLPGPPVTIQEVSDGILSAIGHPEVALWIGLTAHYRLLGFLLASVGRNVWGPPIAVIHAAYLWPRRRSPDLMPALVAAATAWARSRGAPVIGFQSRRARPRAFARVGFHATGECAWVKET